MVHTNELTVDVANGGDYLIALTAPNEAQEESVERHDYTPQTGTRQVSLAGGEIALFHHVPRYGPYDSPGYGTFFRNPR